MRSTRTVALVAVIALLAGACTAATPSNAPAPSTSTAPAATPTPSPTAAPSASASAASAPSPSASAAPPSPSPLPADPAEAVIPNVEKGASITFWTYYLSPTFDNYIKATIDRFKATYPGVEVKWEDHQLSFLADLDKAFGAGKAPDVMNLSVLAGWVGDYARKGHLLGLNDKVPKSVQDTYFPGLWNEQLVGGQNYQFPWYQAISVDLVNKAIFDKAGLTADQFPKTVQELPALCKTLKAKTATVCDIRLSVDDLLAEMTYEGGVKVLSDDGKKFTFNSADGVAWLQMYVDMVAASTVDTTVLMTGDDHVGQAIFSAGQAPFYETSPNVARDIGANNATLYSNLAIVPAPLGKSGVAGKGLHSISVSKDTKYPNASLALAQYFTNPRSMAEFSKLVAIYPSSPAAYDDPFFTIKPQRVEDRARPLAKGIVSTYKDIVPAVPKKAEVNQVVLKAVQDALFSKVPAKQALDKAVADANQLIK